MKKGFTFIELLVSITIIAALVAGGAAVYSSVSRNSRDAKRKSDIEAIRQALEMYRADYREYPLCANITCLAGDATFKTYLSTIPTDPKTHNNYDYSATATAGRYYSYCIQAQMENTPSDPGSCTPTAPNNYAQKNP